MVTAWCDMCEANREIKLVYGNGMMNKSKLDYTDIVCTECSCIIATINEHYNLVKKE